MKLIGTLFSTVFLVALVQAGINTLSPYSSTPWTGGQPQNIQIADDGQQPSLSSLHNITCDLYVGNSQAQFFAQNCATGVDGATTSTIACNVPATVGPVCSCYFIKYTSGNYTAYSGSFTINGVSGTIQGFDPSMCTAKPNASPAATGSVKTPTPSSSSGDFNHPISNFAGLSLAIVAVAFTLL
ncbi:27343_t:CDS:2 [Dentiscutata erythropus]|uniref:27343_t:CDS:1 n=1 Tax=Dentiscutata erythropus TaxID=1348616 RepID=A0A9N9A391_9GLOM|nr:27343_t:CDS:2 [Dentiscutata erythropus]